MKKLTKLIALVILCNNNLQAQNSSSYWANTVPIYPATGPGDNTGFGISALNNLGTAVYDGCTAFGYYSLNQNNTGTHNTGAGAYTLYYNIDGVENTAIGYNSLYNNNMSGTGSNKNTAVGVLSLYSNDIGSNNTAVGKLALTSNTNGNNNTAFGFEALIDNSGVSGNYGEDNTAGGYEAMRYNLSGIENTAIGHFSLHDNRWGESNTAIGASALELNYYDGTTYGMYNTAVGHRAALANTGGWYNTALGKESLFFNTSGFSNTAIGMNAVYKTGASMNVGAGNNALYYNISGAGNTAFGNYALYKYTGDYNVAAGYNAMVNNPSSSATGNCAVGYQSLIYSNPGYNNTMIGATTDMSSSLHNSSAFGYGATNTSNNQIWLGNASVSMVEGKVTPVSDGRFKTNVSEDDVKGLDFIKKLRPVVYNFDTKKFNDFINKNIPDSIQKVKDLKIDFTESTKVRECGFIAQEVEVAALETGFNFNGLVKPTNENESYALSYELFVVPLVKAVQEQQTILNDVALTTKALKEKLNEQQKLIDDLLSNPGNDPVLAQFNQATEGFVLTSQQIEGKTSINYELPSKTGNCYLALFNSEGKQINTFDINSNTPSNSLVVGSLTKGNYFYTVVADGKVLGMQRMIIE